MPYHSKDTVAVLGIDIGKNIIHRVGLSKHGAIVLREKLSRRQLDARLANLPPCLIGMEACVCQRRSDLALNSPVSICCNEQVRCLLSAPDMLKRLRVAISVVDPPLTLFV